MKDWEVICELRAGNRLLKRERYKLLEKNETLQSWNKQQTEQIKELETEIKELRELRIIFDDDSALRHVIKLREEIKELKKCLYEKVLLGTADLIAYENSHFRGSTRLTDMICNIRKDVEKVLINVENTPKTNPQTDSSRE